MSWSVKLLEWFKTLNSTARTILFAVCLICILAAVIPIANNVKDFFTRKEATPITRINLCLDKIKNITDLATAEYDYTGVVKVHKDRTNPKSDIAYYVSYTGSYKAGIDFSAIDVITDPDDPSQIIISIPQIHIINPNVDPDSLDYIFLDNSAKTETVHAVAYQACVDQLRSVTGQDSSLLKIANDNARELIKALVDPLMSQTDPSYTIKFIDAVGDNNSETDEDSGTDNPAELNPEDTGKDKEEQNEEH